MDVQDNQARRLLNDIHNFGAWLQQDESRSIAESVVAHRWMERSFEPTVAAVPEGLRARREPAEIFHEVLDHWQRLSGEERRDVELSEAARHYVDHVLRRLPDERVIAPSEGQPDEPADDLAGMFGDPAPSGMVDVGEEVAEDR